MNTAKGPPIFLAPNSAAIEAMSRISSMELFASSASEVSINAKKAAFIAIHKMTAMVAGEVLFFWLDIQ